MQGLLRSEILSFMKRDFSQYAWSLRTLDRWMREFGLYRTDRTVTEDALRNVVKEELDGSGKLLGTMPWLTKLDRTTTSSSQTNCPCDDVRPWPKSPWAERIFKQGQTMNKGEVYNIWPKLGPFFRWTCKADGLSKGCHSPCNLRLSRYC